MNKSIAVLLALVPVGGWLLAGCDNPAPPVYTPEGQVVKAVVLQADDPEEVEMAKAVEAARADYQYRLSVLKDYYFRVGNMDKMAQAENETRNLQTAQYFRFLGIETTVPPGQSLAGADERLLVEETIAARQAWLGGVTKLRDFYRAKNEPTKVRLMQSALDRFGPERQYTYFLEAEIPGPDLRPTEVIPAADELFQRAYKLFQEGKGPLHTFVTTDYAKQRQAIALFRRLIQEYPTSTKIALSAYYIADIYKEYFNEDVRAVKWYERAWQWDPHITEPARFQAATVYDIRLKDPVKAVELYRASITNDPWRLLNREHARRRIEELTGKKP